MTSRNNSPAVTESLTAAEYLSAERFLPWNRDAHVANAEIQHHWIGKEDRFWYQRTNAAGEKEFVVTDAATGSQMPAFDHKKVAAALASASGKKVDPAQLPFVTFSYAESHDTVQFHFDGKHWTCKVDGSSCVEGRAKAEGHEALSPDGKWVAFLKDWNIWLRPSAGGAAFALTVDGVEHYSYAIAPGISTHPVTDLRHGISRPPLVIWSPDSRYLLTHRMDERKVNDFWLIQAVPDDGSLRPKLHTYRYSMPGDEHTALWEPVVLNVETRNAVALAATPVVSLAATPIEKHDAWWSKDSNSVYYLNVDRYAKWVSLHKADPVTGAVSEVLRESSDMMVHLTAGNVLDFPLIRTLNNGDVIWYSQRDGWGHLYYYDSTGKLRNQITKGEWPVRTIVRVDEANERVYFTASGREPSRDVYERRLYSVQFDGSGMQLLTPEEAEHEPFVLAMVSLAARVETDADLAEKGAFSPSGKYIVASYSRPDMPPVVALRSADGKVIKQLEQADISKLRAGGYTPVEPFQVLAADGKTPIFGNLYRPSTFNPKKKYPIIDANYPGPQMIRTGKSFNAANFSWFEAQSLAELGFIVVTIDGRGTPHRSRDFLEYSYGWLGKASEIEDHIAGIRQLAQRYPYLDLDRVGIDGVSGGGFRAAQAILGYPDFYKVAVSAEGSHDFRVLMAPWAENYNGPLSQSDYDACSTPRLAANLEGKLLLMHGEMDDNVSPTLTMKLVDALIKANRDFDLLIIPNGNHEAFITSPYFIRRKWDFFVRHLLGKQPPANYAIKPPQG